MKLNEPQIVTLGAVAAFILRLLKPAKESWRTIIWRAITSFVAIPITLMLNNKYKFDQETLLVISTAIGFFLFQIIQVIEDKLPSIASKKVDKFFNNKK